MTRQHIFDYCAEKYGVEPDYPFEKTPEVAVLRHRKNKKWFGIIMVVSKRKFGLERDEKTDVMNLKLAQEMIGSFNGDDGVFPAYHMNKSHWVSVILDMAEADTVKFLLDVSFEMTK
jgi:predicted DNA-binding protein (MmcQ/YjbR family)